MTEELTTFTELESGLTRYTGVDGAAPVDTVDYGDKEVLRVYSVQLRVLGSDATFAIEVPLRYDAAGAQRRPHDSTEAHYEAFKRACKLERNNSHTADDTCFVQGDVHMLRTRLVSPRVPKAHG